MVVSGLEFDSRIHSLLAELPPVLPGDFDAEQVQHMAVIQDFA